MRRSVVILALLTVVLAAPSASQASQRVGFAVGAGHARLILMQVKVRRHAGAPAPKHPPVTISVGAGHSKLSAAIGFQRTKLTKRSATFRIEALAHEPAAARDQEGVTTADALHFLFGNDASDLVNYSSGDAGQYVDEDEPPIITRARVLTAMSYAVLIFPGTKPRPAMADELAEIGKLLKDAPKLDLQSVAGALDGLTSESGPTKPSLPATDHSACDVEITGEPDAPFPSDSPPSVQVQLRCTKPFDGIVITMPGHDPESISGPDASNYGFFGYDATGAGINALCTKGGGQLSCKMARSHPGNGHPMDVLFRLVKPDDPSWMSPCHVAYGVRVTDAATVVGSEDGVVPTCGPLPRVPFS